MDTEKRYCQECGKPLIPNLKPAGEAFIEHPDYGRMNLGSNYNRKTGEKQYVLHFKCPDWSIWSLFTHHDNYYEHEVFTKSDIKDKVEAQGGSRY